MKLIDSKTHGILDYAMALAFLMAPSVFDLTGYAAAPAYGAGVFLVLTSLLTRYPLGIVGLLPFRLHGKTEGLLAIAFLAAPWLMGFYEHAASRNFYLVAGTVLLAIIALTDYKGRRAMKGPHAGWSREEAYQWPDDWQRDATQVSGRADSSAPNRFH